MALEKLQLKWDKVILARTVSADLESVDIEKYDLLVFYSPSEISSLLGRFPAESVHPKIAVFGNGTARAAVEGGLTVSAMAPTPEAPSMTKALDIYIRRINAGEEVAPVELQEKTSDLAIIENAKKTKRSRSVKTATSGQGK